MYYRYINEGTHRYKHVRRYPPPSLTSLVSERNRIIQEKIHRPLSIIISNIARISVLQLEHSLRDTKTTFIASSVGANGIKAFDSVPAAPHASTKSVAFDTPLRQSRLETSNEPVDLVLRATPAHPVKTYSNPYSSPPSFPLESGAFAADPDCRIAARAREVKDSESM